ASSAQTDELPVPRTALDFPQNFGRPREVVDQHGMPNGDLSLEAMAAEVDITPIYLARAFKAAVGQSPHRYVLARRIERAKELLRNSEMPVVDVALSSGFSSQSHLSYWFQRYVGVSPAAYRQHRAS